MKSILLPLLAIASVPVPAAVVTDPPAPNLKLGHTAPLTAVAYSADGKTVVSLDATGEVRWRYAATGAPQFLKRLPEASSMARLAPDGSLLTAGAGGVVNWWAPPLVGKPLALVRTFGKPPPVRTALELMKPDTVVVTSYLKHFEVAPDGSALATLNVEDTRTGNNGRGTSAAVVRIWNTADGTPRRVLDPIPFDQVAPVIGLSDAGKTLMVAYPNHAVSWLDVASGEIKKKWQPPEEAAQKAEDGDAEDERRMKMLPEGIRSRIPKNSRARREAMLQKPEYKFGEVQEFSADGSRLLSSTLLGYKVWDLTTGTAHLLEDSSGMSTAVFSPDGSLVAQGGGSGFMVWDAAGAQRNRQILDQGKLTALAFAPDSKTFAVADDRALVRIFDTDAGVTAPKVVLPGFFEPWRQIVSAGDGMLVATSTAVANFSARGAVRWLPLEPIQSPVAPPPGLRSAMSAVTVSADGTLQAEAVYFTSYAAHLEDKNIPKGELRVRELATNKILWREADTGRGSVPNLLWLADDSLLLGKAGFSMSIRFLAEPFGGFQRRDGRTGEQKPLGIAEGTTRSTSLPGSAETLVGAADGSRVAVGDGNGIHVLDMKAGIVRCYLDNNWGGRAGRYAMSVDGRWLAGSSRTGTLQLWDLNHERKEYDNAPDVQLTLGDAAAKAQAIGFGADGTLVAGLADGRLLAWKPEFLKGATPQWETAATASAITAVAFAKDGTRVWSGDERGALTQRDSATGALQSGLRLRPGKPGGAPYEWIRWNSAGKVEASSRQ